MRKNINKIKKYIKSIIIIIKNYNYLTLFILKVLIKKKNIFCVGSTAIGHFPLSLFFSKQFFGNNSIYFYSANTSNANDFLYAKSKELFNFDQRYLNVYEIMKAVKIITFGIFNFQNFPEHMLMGKKINFAKAFDCKTKLFEFNDKENKKGESFLSKNNINKEKLVCFIVRTGEYNKIYGTPEQANREDGIRKFYNVNPKAYISSLKYLLDSGYSIIRMGKGFSNPFPYTHPNFFDYAVSDDRSDFLDIWLSANCSFFFGTTNGIITLPSVFNKPYLGTNTFPLGTTYSYLPKSVHLPRLVKKKWEIIKFERTS